VGGDVSIEADVTRIIEEAQTALGEIDVLAANAGAATVASLDALDIATFDRTIAVNLRSAFLLAQAVLPSMRRRHFGRLLFVSSTAAHVGGVVGPHYAASKAGLIGLMHGYASRLAAEGITANAIAPGLIETEFGLEQRDYLVSPPHVIDKPGFYGGRHAQRLVHAAEVAGA
jgi:3-oxoacyl-[acyl-carrier protein] reductase